MGLHVYNHWKRISGARDSEPAVAEPASSMTSSFRDLREMATRNADQLAALLNPANRIVAYQLANSAEWLSVFLACQALQAIALPLDPDVPQEATEDILQSLRVSALIDATGIRVIEGGTKRQPACLVKLTSGSTGTPRPLFFSDDQMLADGHNIMRTMGISGRDSNLATIPMGHSYGLGNLVMPCIMAGCPIQVCRDPFPHALAQAVAKGNPSVYPTVPAILRTLVRSDVDPGDFKAIRLWISAGSMLEAKIARCFKDKFGKPVHNFYGSSETGGIAYDRKGDSTLHGSSVGKPLNGVNTFLGSSRRLVVSSEAVYTRHNPMGRGLPGRCLLPDKATIQADGSIRLEGRTARIAKIGGKRLSLAEIERILNNITEVHDAYVDAYQDSGGRTRLAAVVVSGTPVGELQEILKKRIALWKLPSRWIVIGSMPLTARGKPDQAVLRNIVRQSLQEKETP